MKLTTTIFAAAAMLPAVAQAAPYTDKAAFTAAAPGAVLIEDFETVPASQLDRGLASLSRPSISFTPITNDVYVYSATPTSPEYVPGVITAPTKVLTADGLENFRGTLITPASAFGFDVILSSTAATSVTFYGGDVPLETILFPLGVGPYRTFAGITSATPITGFTFTSTGVNRYDSGVDNLLAAPASASGVPEPASWGLMILGLGAVGSAMRRRGARAVAVAA